MPFVRSFLAFLSACGFVACEFVYIDSFFGATPGSSSQRIVLLVVGVCSLHLAIFAAEYPASMDRKFFSTWLARNAPGWAANCDKLFRWAFLAHLVWSFVQSHFALPTVEDGQYVLNSHGRILKVLTQTEYLELKEGELRVVATLMISFYFSAMMYWWFRRNRNDGN
jgi:hypothetical protein